MKRHSEFVRYVDAPAATTVGANKSGSLGLWSFALSMMPKMSGNKMMSTFNRIAAAPLLLGLQVAVALADAPPKLDVTTTCNAASQYAISAGRNKDACIADEHTAETTLAQNWSKYSADNKSQCIGTVKAGGPSSYVELLSCIEVLRDAKQLGEEDPLMQSAQPVASAPQSTHRRRR
jgi:hypothetical protein